jgi:hypothetical protein
MNEKYQIGATPELPNDTLIGRPQFPTRIQNALSAAALRTVGEVRETSDKMLWSLPDLESGSLVHLRETLGLTLCDGVRPASGLKAKDKWWNCFRLSNYRIGSWSAELV